MTRAKYYNTLTCHLIFDKEKSCNIHKQAYLNSVKKIIKYLVICMCEERENDKCIGKNVKGGIIYNLFDRKCIQLYVLW